ncbi:phosphatidylinositol kinase- protein kinase tor1 [Cystobasidiomycetes sp. EMM_F5]
MATPAKLHAGALACCALAKVAPADEQEAIECIWDPLLDVRDRDTTANRSIMEFVALCAPRDPEAFCSKWLSSVFPWLADASKREKEQVAALHSTAKLLPLVGLRATGYLDGIVFNFTQGLVQQRRLPGLHDALLAVVAGCVRAFGSPMKEFIAAVLEPMCSGGLSEALVTTLDVVIKNIPALAYDIRRKQ